MNITLALCVPNTEELEWLREQFGDVDVNASVEGRAEKENKKKIFTGRISKDQVNRLDLHLAGFLTI